MRVTVCFHTLHFVTIDITLGGREEGRKGGREEGRKGGREEGRKGGREEGRKGGRDKKYKMQKNVLFRITDKQTA